jgi:ABC-type Mn2+/Zn2+ transport system permease subunit
MLVISVLSSVTATIVGILISYHADLSTSGCIVLAQASLFVLSLIVAPKYGILSRRRKRI